MLTTLGEANPSRNPSIKNHTTGNKMAKQTYISARATRSLFEWKNLNMGPTTANTVKMPNTTALPKNASRQHWNAYTIALHWLARMTMPMPE